MSKKIFVSGATGFQGRPTTIELISKGYQVVSISKQENSIEGVEINKGEFENPNDWNNALKNVDVAVFTLPLVFDLDVAKKMTRNFIEAATKQKIDLVIFNSSFDLPKQKTELLALDLKVETKRMLDQSNLNVITLVPDVYIDNLVAPWSIPLILEQGILPYPIKNGQKIPWISHLDLAKFTVSAIEKPELVGQTLPIGGNQYTGEEIATAISKKIDKPIQFIGLSPDDFEKNIAPNFGEIPAREISNLYRYLENNIEEINSKKFIDIHHKLDVKPQTLEEWVDNVKWN